MKIVKIMIAALLLSATFSFVATAQDKQTTTTKSEAKTTELKEHKCNPGCNATKCNYLHGEKGHKCTAACKKANKKA